MKRFNHLKSGMSIIEVMITIAILAIFGSSLFLMQEFLFDRMIASQRMLIANLRMQTEFTDYQTNILKELFDQDGSVKKSLQKHTKDFTAPDMSVKITTKSDFKETSLESFKNLHVITVQAEQDEKEYGKSYAFAYIPEVSKK